MAASTALSDTALVLQRAAVLRINFDEGSKGSDVHVLDTRLVRAAKQHKGVCYPCGGDIEKWELHRVERGLMDGKVGNCRTCQTCCLALVGRNDKAIEARYTLGRKRSEERRKGTS